MNEVIYQQLDRDELPDEEELKAELLRLVFYMSDYRNQGKIKVDLTTEAAAEMVEVLSNKLEKFDPTRGKSYFFLTTIAGCLIGVYRRKEYYRLNPRTRHLSKN